MLDWLKLLAPVAGAFVTGWVIEYLRHRWKQKETYQEILAEKRFSACNQLMKMIVELVGELSPIQLGIEPLRWPKDRRITPNPSDEDIERARKVAQKIGELNYFVAGNALVLGSKVCGACNKQLAALHNLKAKAQLAGLRDTENPVVIMWASIEFLNRFIDEIAQAIQQQLYGIDVKCVPTPEWQKHRSEGWKMFDDMVAKAKEELKQNR